MFKNILKLLPLDRVRIVDLHDDGYSSSGKQSIVFISFNKCATTYFSNKIFKQISDLQHVDYFQYLYSNDVNVRISIKKEGYLYGVIRLLDEDHPRSCYVDKILNDGNFVKTKQIYFTRDPRDILVSSYYSFGYTHSLSDVDKIRRYQVKKRKEIQNQTLDEYALNEVHNIKEKFIAMKKLMDNNYNIVHLKYEDMISNFDSFYHKLSSIFSLSPEFRQNIFRDTRPKEIEDISSHRRSGKVSGYRIKLQKDTISKLNHILEGVLIDYKYPL